MIFVTIIGLMLLGWLIGSLVNTIADVLPQTRRLGRAVCQACTKPRTIVEAVFLRPCSGCGQHRSARAWVVQIAAVLITTGLWFYPSARLNFWLGLVLLTYFGVVAVIDIEHRLILYVESAFGAVLGLIVGVMLHGWVPTVLGGLGGLAMMAGLFLLGAALARLFGRLRGQPIDEDALGFSDILLCGNLGLVLGWPGIIVGVFYTIFIAGAGSLLIILFQLLRRKYQPFAPVAYGPYLLLAAVILLYWPK